MRAFTTDVNSEDGNTPVMVVMIPEVVILLPHDVFIAGGPTGD